MISLISNLIELAQGREGGAGATVVVVAVNVQNLLAAHGEDTRQDALLQRSARPTHTKSRLSMLRRHENAP